MPERRRTKPPKRKRGTLDTVVGASRVNRARKLRAKAASGIRSIKRGFSRLRKKFSKKSSPKTKRTNIASAITGTAPVKAGSKGAKFGQRRKLEEEVLEQLKPKRRKNGG